MTLRMSMIPRVKKTPRINKTSKSVQRRLALQGVKPGQKRARYGVKKSAVVTFLLDESGSMSTIALPTRDGFNAYVRELRGSLTDFTVAFSLLKFSSDHYETHAVGRAPGAMVHGLPDVRTVHAGVPLAKVDALTLETYQPNGNTPLIDACMSAIQATKDAVAGMGGKPKVIVVFQTDGEENSSKESTRDSLKKAIAEGEAAGWQFVFLGAGINAYTEAQRMGLRMGSTVSYAQANTQEMFAETAKSSSNFMKGTQRGVAFSAQMRSLVGEQHTQGASFSAAASADAESLLRSPRAKAAKKPAPRS